MPHFIELDSDKAIFTLRYVGDISLPDRLSAADDLCVQIGNSHQVKLLIDVRELNNIMTEDEQEYFAQYLSEKKECENSKVAILYRKDKPNSNAGIESFAYLNNYHMTPFNSKKEAMLWLDGQLK